MVYNWETYKQPTNKFFHQPQFGPTTPIIPPKLSNFSWKPLKQTLPYFGFVTCSEWVGCGSEVGGQLPTLIETPGLWNPPKKINILCQ